VRIGGLLPGLPDHAGQRRVVLRHRLRAHLLRLEVALEPPEVHDLGAGIVQPAADPAALAGEELLQQRLVVMELRGDDDIAIGAAHRVQGVEPGQLHLVGDPELVQQRVLAGAQRIAVQLVQARVEPEGRPLEDHGVAARLLGVLKHHHGLALPSQRDRSTQAAQAGSDDDNIHR
jgi:hypothetical protein